MPLNLSKTLLVDRKRAIKDKLFSYSITAGGVFVLLTLLLIFAYLLYVVLPIFSPVTIQLKADIPYHDDEKNLALGLDEKNMIAYQITDNGHVSFYSLMNKKVGSLLLNKKVIQEYSEFAQAASNKSYLFANTQGQVLIFKPDFDTSYIDNITQLNPKVSYPLGPIKLQFDVQKRAISNVAFEMNDSAVAIAAITQDQRLSFMLLTQTDEMLEGEVQWIPERVELPTFTKAIEQMLISPDLKNLFIRSANNIWIYDVSDIKDIKIKATLEFNDVNTKISYMQLLSGASSLIVAQDNGVVSQWFEVLSDHKHKYNLIRQFQGTENINSIAAESYRKVFYTTDQQGYLSVFNSTSKSSLIHEKITTNKNSHIAISSDAEAFLVADKSSLLLYSINNKHPEITWSSLWQKIWYEDYPEPAYLWQSTSANDEFEAKMSLIPITFGTIKTAFYAMLIATPIAIAGAIYTAYFMSAGARSFVKPTIEIMEALPTVILGFLAGLWLAPIVENNLPGVMLMFISLPLSVFVCALGWSLLPKEIKQAVPDGYHFMFLIPLLIIVGYLSMQFSQPLELWLFAGDSRVYMSDELGIDFNQRNAFVVGIAMGFAVIPTIFTIAEDAIFSVPKSLTMGSMALGATPWQTLTKVVFLAASPGIFSAVMMGAGRAVGETMIVLMATGNTPIMDWNIFSGMRTLSATIAIEIPESEIASSHYRVLFLAAFVLFIFTFIFNTLAEFIRQRLRKKYSSL